MLKLFFILLFSLNLYSQTFKVASYNIENLFDLSKDKSDYKEYIPYTKSNWNQKNFDIKIKNSIKVLKDLDADIIALQEIENTKLLQLLQKKLPKYKYISFAKYKNASVGIGFLSKFKILEEKTIKVNFRNKLYRPILKNVFLINNYKFTIYNNHWPSKRTGESKRVKYAKTLFDEISKLPKDEDYILLGDFNSNYDEFKTIQKQKRLNDTSGITGINQVLNTSIDKKFVSYDDILKYKRRVHYNLWLDLAYENRFSSIYRGNKNTPDNIILSPALFDNKKISYKLKSFEVFKANYLYKNKKILRWKIKNSVHQGYGFSDHLAIMATFTIKQDEKNPLKDLKDENITTIKELYEKEKLINDVVIKDAFLIYKHENNAIVKQKNNKAIYFYKNAQDLKFGFTYTLKIKEIENYFGLKEVKKFSILSKHENKIDIKKHYLNFKEKDYLKTKYINEILTNISGIYKKGYLYYKKNEEEKKVRLYIKNKNIKIKENSHISLKEAHIGYYKNQIQLVIYKKSEIDVN